MEKHKKQYQKYRNKLRTGQKKNTLLTKLNNHNIIVDFYGRL